MKILSIDTSCDDTSIAIIKALGKGSFEILSNIVSSQIKLHQEYGGVYPSLAKREHQKNLVPVLKKALEGAELLSKAVDGASLRPHKGLGEILEREIVLLEKLEKFFQKYKKPKVDAIAVTIGPGLDPCLWVGINFAKALSFYWNLPIIPVNHIEAHVLANLLTANIVTPAIGLIVSGGHTQLVLMKKIGKYEIIGETRDDAAGECFDKTARILGLNYPGGPEIAKQAAKAKKPLDVKMPRPMINTGCYDFSFSGLKTAVLYDFKKRTKKQRQSQEYIQAMSTEIQQSIIDVLIKKTLLASKEYKVKTIILGGGVTANKELKKQFKEKVKTELPKTKLLVSSPNLCTDNAVMIGITAYLNQKDKTPWKKLTSKPNLRI